VNARAIDSLLLRFDGKAPLHEQIYASLRERILKGELPRGVRLPSSRQLSAQLGVARSTVMQALEALQAEGYVVARAASATRVAPELPEELQRQARPRIAQPAKPARLSAATRALIAQPSGAPRLGSSPRAFRPGVPALDLFPVGVWSRLLARVTTGTQGAFEETARLVLDPGDEAWLEEPGYLGARHALLAASARIVPVPVDDRGLDVEAGVAKAPNARLVCLAPSHQYPFGVTMSLARRLQLLSFAKKARAVIVEDDYDSEFRHRGRPLMALQGLDEGACVVYFGTFSKTMFPGLRLGFLVAPQPLVDAFTKARVALASPASVIEQAALARFIENGHFATHLRRMRTAYRERNEALVEALHGECAGALEPHPSETGMQLWAETDVPDVPLRDEAAARGVEASAISDYYLEEPRRRGLLLGYGCVRPKEMRQAAQRLMQAYEAVRGA
jgi:GntR family transcriptional regulator/MocR family aminotransferase